jgi:glyoxylase-like metal-dependent hydrolase (beta-lactamase superfamily II)
VKIGPYELTLINAGNFRLDGGAMHGVVPKTLWSRAVSADADNRVEYATNCLLIEGQGRRILVETGNGDKWSDRDRSIYAIEEGSGIARRLRERGVAPDTIDTVVLTHLHFDHIGGATWRDEAGGLHATFARARHVVQRAELRDARSPHERNRASYLGENIDPLVEAGLFETVEGEHEIAPAVCVTPTPGHTEGHQSVLVQGGGQVGFFCGDVIPTSLHLRLPYIMAYDLMPVVTLETKRRLLERMIAGRWIVFWGHDLALRGGTIERAASGAPVVRPVDAFA